LRLASLAVRIRAMKFGHFETIIGEIDSMLQTLSSEGAADISKRDQCKEEYTKIESIIKHNVWLVEKNNAKIGKLNNLIDQHEQEKGQTISDIDDVQKQQQQLTQERTEENTAFLQARSDDQSAIDLLMSARTALEKYYKNNKIEMGDYQSSVKALALAQQPNFEVSADQAPEAVLADPGKRKHEAKSILQILTMIMEDLNDEIKNGMKSEEEAQLEYEKLMAAAKKLENELEAKKSSLIKAIAQRKIERGEEESDRAINQDQVDAEESWKAAIKTDCDWIIKNFETRAKARTAEMEGLTGAKEYLVGYMEREPALLERERKPTFDDNALSNTRFLGFPR